MRTIRFLIPSLLLILIVFPACSDDDDPGEELANPASVFCIEQGGELDIRDEEGGQNGYCIFPNGAECPEWEFFHGDCSPGDVGEGPSEPGPGLANPASVHCIDEGGRLEMRTDANGTYGVCVFPNGVECEEWAFFRGECLPGDAGE